MTSQPPNKGRWRLVRLVVLALATFLFAGVTLPTRTFAHFAVEVATAANAEGTEAVVSLQHSD